MSSPAIMQHTMLIAPRQFARESVPLPKPGPDEVRIRVSHVGVCGSDISAYYGRHPYINCPIVLGHEFAGVVDARGIYEEGPEPGTPVTVIPHIGCWQCPACRQERYNLCDRLRVIGCQAPGAHADFTLAPARMAVAIPVEISLETAALVEPAAVALHGIQRAMHAGDRVVVVGAGPIGNFAMQCAFVLGAVQVYIADVNAARLTLAASHGASMVINLQQETLEDGVARCTSGEPIDLFVDAVGGNGVVFNSLLKLAPRGARVLQLGLLGKEFAIPQQPDIVEHELTHYGSSMYVPADFHAVLTYLAAGQLNTTGMVTHRFSFPEIPAAFAMIDAQTESFFKVMFVAS